MVFFLLCNGIANLYPVFVLFEFMTGHSPCIEDRDMTANKSKAESLHVRMYAEVGGTDRTHAKKKREDSLMTCNEICKKQFKTPKSDKRPTLASKRKANPIRLFSQTCQASILSV